MPGVAVRWTGLRGHRGYPAAVVTWLASAESAGVTGRVIDVNGQYLGIAEGWHLGPTVPPVDDPARIEDALAGLLAGARPHADVFGRDEGRD